MRRLPTLQFDKRNNAEKEMGRGKDNRKNMQLSKLEYSFDAFQAMMGHPDRIARQAGRDAGLNTGGEIRNGDAEPGGISTEVIVKAMQSH